MIVCNQIMDLWRKVLRSELSFSREGIWRRLEGLITKSLKLKCCSRSSLPKMLSNTAAQKITEDARKEKNMHWIWKTERPLPVAGWLMKMILHHRLSPKNSKSLRTTFWKNTFGELLLVFQLFKQFDLEIQCFIFKFQKLFSHRIFKNGYPFLHFLWFKFYI